MNQDSWISGLKSWHPALILTVLLCLPVVLMLAHPRFSRHKLSTNINMKDSVIQTTVWDDSIPVKGPQRNRLFSQSLLQALLRGGSKNCGSGWDGMRPQNTLNWTIHCLLDNELKSLPDLFGFPSVPGYTGLQPAMPNDECCLMWGDSD